MVKFAMSNVLFGLPIVLWFEKVKYMDAILPNKNTALSLAFYPWERTIFSLHTYIYLQLYPHRKIIVFSYLLQ